MVEKRFEIGVRVGANVYDGVLVTRRRRAAAAASRREGHRLSPRVVRWSGIGSGCPYGYVRPLSLR